MQRYFNVTGACNPQEHYMVDLLPRLKKIKRLIDEVDSATNNQVFLDFWRCFAAITLIEESVQHFSL